MLAWQSAFSISFNEIVICGFDSDYLRGQLTFQLALCEAIQCVIENHLTEFQNHNQNI